MYEGDWHSITRAQVLRLAAARAGYFTNLQPRLLFYHTGYTLDIALPHANLIVAELSHIPPDSKASNRLYVSVIHIFLRRDFQIWGSEVK
jgi:hypothetical protein